MWVVSVRVSLWQTLRTKIRYDAQTVFEADRLFTNMVDDFALLNSLEVRLVLAHGVRPPGSHRAPRGAGRGHAFHS